MSAAYDPTRVEPYTPAEVREIARAAYRAGVDRVAPFVPLGEWGWPGTFALRAEAADLYPAPMVERPRVVADPHDATVEWSAGRDGSNAPALRWRDIGHRTWVFAMQSMYATPERVALWADLIATPTERVPA